MAGVNVNVPISTQQWLNAEPKTLTSDRRQYIKGIDNNIWYNNRRCI